MPDHPQLLEALERGALVLFLGADLPQTVTGLPSRAELARGLAERLGGQDQPDPNRSLAQVAQRVSRAGNRFDFTDYLRRELDTAGKPVPAFCRGLAAFAQAHTLPAIITTTYDDFLERALRDAGVPFDRVARGSDVAFVRADRPALLKLYGDAQMPDTLVVTEDDHYGLWRDRDKEMLLDEVRRALQRNTVLFLGYNLSDPDFNLLWREVLDKLGRFARTAYAVWPGLPEGEAQMWRDRSIQVLEADPWGLAGGASPAEGAGAVSPVVPAGATEAVFDQRGQQVGTQINVAGDYHVTTASGERSVAIGGNASGNTFNMGDTGAPAGNAALIARLYQGLQRLDAVEIETLCLLHAPQIKDKFGRGQRRDEMINVILEHCRLKPEDAAELVQHLK